MLSFIFDPINFIGGALLTSAVFGAKNVIIKRRGSSIWTEFEKSLAQQRANYASRAAEWEKLEAKIDEAENHFTTTFPEFSFTQNYTSGYLGSVRKYIEDFLKAINAADICSPKTKAGTLQDTLKRMEDLNKALANDLPHAMREVSYFNTVVDDNVKLRASTLRGRKSYMERLAKAKASFEDMSKSFSPVYLEKIPAAIFNAEKALAAYEQYVVNVQKSFNRTASSRNNSVATQMKKHMNVLENTLNGINDFSSVAMGYTAKYRTILRRMIVKTPADKAVYDKALESLIKAELKVYNQGNPYNTFAIITDPFVKVATEKRLIRNTDRVLKASV